MFVQGTIEEINDVIQYFKPGFPIQNLESLNRNECFYVLNQVPVKIILEKERKKHASV